MRKSALNLDTPVSKYKLIPDYHHIPANTLRDLVFFGKGTIRALVRSWRSTAGDISASIKAIEERIKLFDGLNPEGVQKIAANYESPEFPSIGVPRDSWSGDPEPLDAASINRKSGATTFNACGWCKYASGGTCRYSYYITTSCGLIQNAGLSDNERRFNTPCTFQTAPEEFFAAVRAGLRVSRDEAVAEKRRADGNIQLLLRLEGMAEEKPVLPSERPHDYYNIDDPVVCYIGSWKERIMPDQFATAKVINGYRHHDGCVSVCYDDRIHSGPYLDGHGGGYGMSRPEMLHTREYEYLIANPQFADAWARSASERALDGWDPDAFLAALAEVRASVLSGT